MASNPSSNENPEDDNESSNTPKKPQPLQGTVPSSKDTPSPPSEPFASSENAPRSNYPPRSNHEYPPRSTASYFAKKSKSNPSSSSNPTSSSKANSPPPPPPTKDTLLPVLFSLPPLATLRGRPTDLTRIPYAPNQNDERCIIYCTQTAARRSIGQQPICKTWCWRRLFPQDYMDAEEYRAFQDEKRKQALTRHTSAFGLNSKEIESDAEEEKPGLFGFDGRYVYFGRSRFRARDRMDSMSKTGLSVDHTPDEIVGENDPRQEDKAHMDFLRKYHYSTQIEIAPIPSTILSSISETLTPVTSYINSFSPGGAQEKFALKVWEKAIDGEGWRLLKKSVSDRWSEISAEDKKKGSGKGGGKDGKGGGTPPASGSGSTPPTSPNE